MVETPSPSTTGMAQTSEPTPSKGIRFWMAIICIMLCTFLAAIDATAVATALPTIIATFQGEQFVWIGSSFSLAAVASIPISGNLAISFGRRTVLLVLILIFALGSALCGGAQSMPMLIGGRTVQGIASGGILTVTEIILSDLVPLNERGIYQGFIGLTWAIASCIGPPVGGAFASRKDWTWRGLFYLNLPLTGIALASCIFCLNLKVPKRTFLEKFKLIDWIGNILVIAASTSALLGLTWAGVQFPWSSARVLVPLILGFVVTLEQPFMDWLPQALYACKGSSPVRSGVDILPYSMIIAPFAIIAGGVGAATHKYRLMNIIAWCLIIIGFGLQTTLKVDTATRNWVGFQIISGAGFGLLFTCTVFAILAPLQVEDNAVALSFFIFTRNFFQAWGITIGATVIQNQLKVRLPTEFISQLPDGLEVSYAAIPRIASLPDGLRQSVEDAFAQSLRILWFVFLGISFLGLLSALPMKDIALQNVTDEKWGLKEGKVPSDSEVATTMEQGNDKGDIVPTSLPVQTSKPQSETTQIFSIPSNDTFRHDTSTGATVTPEEIFADYYDVMARLNSERRRTAKNIGSKESLSFKKICRTTTDSEPRPRSRSSSVISTPTTSGNSPASFAQGRLPSPTLEKMQGNNKEIPQAAVANQASNSSPVATPSGSRRSNLSKSKKSKRPSRSRLRRNALHYRQIDLANLDLTHPSQQCTYVHPVWAQRCHKRSINGDAVDWTTNHRHWNTHIVKEYQLMLKFILRIGQGTIISSKELFEKYSGKMFICDICGDVLSRKDALLRHKTLIHELWNKDKIKGTGTSEDSPSPRSSRSPSP
ncbi:hypothetical protein Clacol_006857 [Clathrus columnatus]|uniref:C2H2-type domain-containing protein n=1 Tax=Clathrus columnatus TaxID=1419009 RepID=A0AAV5AD98_9AGAM|nr:hypothetical protein Clacol_006857 [Clathrus columnatus]